MLQTNNQPSSDDEERSVRDSNRLWQLVTIAALPTCKATAHLSRLEPNFKPATPDHLKGQMLIFIASFSIVQRAYASH